MFPAEDENGVPAYSPHDDRAVDCWGYVEVGHQWGSSLLGHIQRPEDPSVYFTYSGFKTSKGRGFRPCHFTGAVQS